MEELVAQPRMLSRDPSPPRGQDLPASSTLGFLSQQLPLEKVCGGGGTSTSPPGVVAGADLKQQQLLLLPAPNP